MDEKAKKIQAFLSDIHVKSDITENGNDSYSITVACLLGDEPLTSAIYFERSNFQINVGGLLSVDKIEEPNLEPEDVQELLANLFGEMQKRTIGLVEHSLLGRRAYSLSYSGSKGIKIFPYETLTETVVKKLGIARNRGNIELVQ